MSKQEIKKLRKNSPVGKIFDFSERLSPMLVKELRQGVRSVSFAGIFITMQSILCIILCILAFDTSVNSREISATIFFIYMIMVCGLQPMRGSSAIASEVSGDTIDLVLLTRLSAWKIVYGKWVSLMAQSLIFTVSLLPYLILRYFFGGMALIDELTLFGFIFALGAVITAITVGSSAIKATILRYIAILGLGGTLFILTLSFLIEIFDRGNSIDILMIVFRLIGTDSLLYFSGGFFLVSLYICWMFLDFGASMIAPLAENRATLRRIIYLIFLSICSITILSLPEGPSGFYGLTTDPLNYFIQLFLAILFVPFFVTTFTEHAYLAPSIALKMKKGKILRMFRYLLYPGWATGTVFLGICIFIHLLLLTTMDDQFSSKIDFLGAFITTILASLVFPAACLTTFAKHTSNRIGIYLIVFIASILVFVITSIVAENIDEDISLIFAWVPPMNIYIAADRVLDPKVVISLNIALITVYGLIILLNSKSAWKHIMAQERLAESKSNNTSTSTDQPASKNSAL